MGVNHGSGRRSNGLPAVYRMKRMGTDTHSIGVEDWCAVAVWSQRGRGGDEWRRNLRMGVEVRGYQRYLDLSPMWWVS